VALLLQYELVKQYDRILMNEHMDIFFRWINILKTCANLATVKPIWRICKPIWSFIETYEGTNGKVKQNCFWQR